MTVGGILCVAVSALLATGAQGVCDLPLATTCLQDQPSLPASPSLAQCRTVLSAITATVRCVRDSTEGCDEGDRTQKISDLTAVQDEITTKCAGLDAIQCDSLGSKYPEFEICLQTVDVTGLVNNIITLWNSNRLGSDTAACGALADAQQCIDRGARDCKVILDENLPELFSNVPHLKQALEVCRGEVSVQPTLTDCTPEMQETKRQAVLANCALVADYSVIGIATVCVAMQNQINCIEQHTDNCPEVADEFLRPRIHSYALVNERFCTNMTLGGVAIRSTDPDCNYESLYACFANTFLYSFLDSSNNGFLPDNIKLLLKFYMWENEDECSAFRFANFTHIQICERTVLYSCQYPLPLTSSLFLSKPADYDESLYRNLNLGPVPINDYGTWYLTYRGSFICFQDCEHYGILKDDITPCLSNIEVAAADVNAIPEDGEAKDKCDTLSSEVECIADVTGDCPIFLQRAESRLAENVINTAVARCEITVDLYPENYGPTSPATTLYPPSSTTRKMYMTTTRATTASDDEDLSNATRTFSTTTRAENTVGSAAAIVINYILVTAAIVISVTSTLLIG